MYIVRNFNCSWKYVIVWLSFSCDKMKIIQLKIIVNAIYPFLIFAKVFQFHMTVLRLHFEKKFSFQIVISSITDISILINKCFQQIFHTQYHLILTYWTHCFQRERKLQIKIQNKSKDRRSYFMIIHRMIILNVSVFIVGY